jgi:hypothetical protein
MIHPFIRRWAVLVAGLIKTCIPLKDFITETISVLRGWKAYLMVQKRDSIREKVCTPMIDSVAV